MLYSYSHVLRLQIISFHMILQLNCLTFGFKGLSVEMSVPSALCRLESNTFRFLVADFWQIIVCLTCKTNLYAVMCHLNLTHHCI